MFVREGSSWSRQAQLLAADGAAKDTFGHSVALQGDTAVVGAYADDIVLGQNEGSVYVFVRSGTSWSQQAKLLASDAAVGDVFGGSVALDGDTIVAGAVLDDTAAGHDAGSAYVFVRSGTVWSQQAQLLAADGTAGSYFGGGVAVSGNTIAVGAYQDDTGGANTGSVYVFVRNGTSWTQQAELLALDRSFQDQMGYAVTLQGDTIVAGALADNNSTGSAYVFVRNGTVWSQQARLAASDGVAQDQFGVSVFVSGDMAIIGAPYDDTPGGINAGSAYVFVRSGTAWTQQAQLLSPDGSRDEQYGSAVSLDGVTAIVGVPNDDSPGGNDSGSAFVYLLQQSTAPDPFASASTVSSSANPSTFGQSVTFTATITAPGGTPTGSVTFSDGATLLGTVALTGGAATYTTSALRGGNHSITAAYAGNGTYSATSAGLDQVVHSGSTIAFSPSAYWQRETAGSVTLTVTRTGGDTTGTASVDYATGAGTASAGVRYANVSGTVSFNAGQTSKTIAIALFDTPTIDGAQTFTVTLTHPNGAILGAAAATVTVMSDDGSPSDFSFPLDGRPDLVWRNETTGNTRVWTMNGTSFVSSADLVPLGGHWKLQGAADFNADGNADLLYRNDADYSTLIWYLNGTGILRTGSAPSVTDANWKIVAIGDMDRDGYPDLIWRHQTSFATAVWLMRDNVPMSVYTLPSVTDSNWQVKGLGDFNRDGQLDIVWRHGPNWITAIWSSPGRTVGRLRHDPARRRPALGRRRRRRHERRRRRRSDLANLDDAHPRHLADEPNHLHLHRNPQHDQRPQLEGGVTAVGLAGSSRYHVGDPYPSPPAGRRGIKTARSAESVPSPRAASSRRGEG